VLDKKRQSKDDVSPVFAMLPSTWTELGVQTFNT